jgi:glycosyltransferase involved in cell wall biosynthesis
VHVVHNGIRLETFQRPPDHNLRESILQGAEGPIVFTPARLHPQKGLSHLIDASPLVPHAVFVLAGDGPERSGLEAQARRLGVGGRVRFLGQRSDIPALLAISDLFVLPSLFEGLPLSLLEAMAAEKPVIATAIGGTTEVVVDRVSGLLVRPAHHSDLADAINSLLANRAFAMTLARNGRQRVAEQFSTDTMVRQVTAHYVELLERRRS